MPQYKLHIYRRSITMQILQDPKLSGASIAPTSQVRTSTILLLLVVGNYKV
jgi:hypothetical protein